MANALTSALDELAGYESPDYTAMYGESAAAQKAALDAQYAAQLMALNERYAKTAQDYEAARGKARNYADLYAIGNNSAAGSAYAATGLSETSRLRESNALQNALNNADREQAGAQGDINAGIAQAGFNQKAQAAALMSLIDRDKLAALQEENRFSSSYALQRALQEESARQFNENLALAQRQDAADQAYWELSTFGRIKTQAAADALGVKMGTTMKSLRGKSSGSSKNNTHTYFERIMAAIQKGEITDVEAIQEAQRKGFIETQDEYRAALSLLGIDWNKTKLY